jgi:phosphatidyl-myo-inositol dimannoside synthase
VLLTVGRMDVRERYKGHDRVIAALPRLVAAGHDVIYVVLGEGDDLPRLKELAAEARVAERVQFKGAVDQKTLIEAHRMADLFVMPSTGEGFGIVFLEAMVSGTPAMGLGVAGASDALGDGELGAAPSEHEFQTALVSAVERPKPSPDTLAGEVRRRFGRQAFNARVDAVLAGLLGAA